MRYLFVALVLSLSFAFAQGSELPCPAGTTDVEAPTYNPVTGKTRSWVCSDALGHVSSPVFTGGLPAGLTFVPPTLTISTAGSGNGALALSGNTSGTCIFTDSATSTTVTMTCTLSGPNGTIANPTFQVPSVGGGLYGNSTLGPAISNGAADVMGWNSGGAHLVNNAGIGWQSAASPLSGGIFDTGFNRMSAGLVGTGTTNAVGDATGSIAAASFQSRGTTFTASGCGNTTLVGGATAGKYTSVTAGACTITITMGNGATSPTGWTCDAHDLTTVADANNVTMGTSTATTANLVEGTVVANDVISFKCTGY